jgi:hypothetical protein
LKGKVLHSAAVITHVNTLWRKNLRQLTTFLEKGGLEVQLIEEQPDSLAGGLFLWFRRRLRQEVIGLRIMLSLAQGAARPLLLVSGQLLSGMKAVAEFLLDPALGKSQQIRHTFLTKKHIAALENFVRTEGRQILFVLEDDARQMQSSHDWILNVSQRLAGESEGVIVNLSLHDSRSLAPDPNWDCLGASLKFFDTTAAYALNKRAAELILAAFDKDPKLYFCSADWAFSLAAQRGDCAFQAMDIFENLSLVHNTSSLGSNRKSK